LISKHKRLTAFTVEDYDLLYDLISRSESVLVTPNTLTETSNLAAQIAEPARTDVLRVLRDLIAKSSEVYVPSETAGGRPEFLRLGLADAALLHTSSTEFVLLTDDSKLYVAAINNGSEALNFNHVRELYL
jgi:hypothetical protein